MAIPDGFSYITYLDAFDMNRSHYPSHQRQPRTSREFYIDTSTPAVVVVSDSPLVIFRDHHLQPCVSWCSETVQEAKALRLSGPIDWSGTWP